MRSCTQQHAADLSAYGVSLQRLTLQFAGNAGMPRLPCGVERGAEPAHCRPRAAPARTATSSSSRPEMSAARSIIDESVILWVPGLRRAPGSCSPPGAPPPGASAAGAAVTAAGAAARGCSCCALNAAAALTGSFAAAGLLCSSPRVGTMPGSAGACPCSSDVGLLGRGSSRGASSARRGSEEPLRTPASSSENNGRVLRSASHNETRPLRATSSLYAVP